MFILVFTSGNSLIIKNHIDDCFLSKLAFTRKYDYDISIDNE